MMPRSHQTADSVQWDWMERASRRPRGTGPGSRCRPLRPNALQRPRRTPTCSIASCVRTASPGRRPGRVEAVQGGGRGPPRYPARRDHRFPMRPQLRTGAVQLSGSPPSGLPDETGLEVIEHLFEHWKRIVARRQSSTPRKPGRRRRPRRPPDSVRAGKRKVEQQMRKRRRAAIIATAAVAVLVSRGRVAALPAVELVTDKVVDEALPGAAPISTQSSSTTPPTISVENLSSARNPENLADREADHPRARDVRHSRRTRAAGRLPRAPTGEPRHLRRPRPQGVAQ